VRVAAPPERGRANAALFELLASALGLPASRLQLVSGASGKDKVIAVEGMTSAEADRLLAAVARKGN